MFGPIQAVAIDDEPSHLLSITAGLTRVGIPCVGYLFDRDTNELQPPPPADGHTFIRLVFMDLNLAELGGVPETSALWANVVHVLKTLLSGNSGPYLLVFWTRVGVRVNEVAEMLYARADALEGVPLPLQIESLSKTEFLVTPPDGKGFDDGLRDFYTALHANIDELKVKIEQSIANNPPLRAVAAWESRAAEAAARAVNEVHRCSTTVEADASKVTESFKKTLAKIAVAASGSTAAKAAPARALDAGMLDISVDQFGASVDEPDYAALVQDAIGDTIKQEIQFAGPERLYAELNTFFHIDRQVTSAKSWDRGVVIAALPSFDEDLLGFNPKDIIASEFVYPIDQIKKALQEQAPLHLQQLQTAPGVVLIEMGADCDHAQDHDRTRRFLIGLEIPKDQLYLAMPSAKDRKLRNGALELLGPWKVEGTVKYLLVSCRRFWTWQRSTPPPGAPRYRLRASLVDKLLHRYSSWSSRPGIVEFS